MSDISKKTVLVTGGSGFIGSQLVDRLLNDGNSVVCLDNLNYLYNTGFKFFKRSTHYDFDRYSFV
jgi:nucleoside-diphosphate-sugar epimerase